MRDSNEKEFLFRRGSLLAVIGPGLLVAATGVGAGDLATASLAGSQLGLQVLWAVVVGAVLKYALNDGLARFQLETGKPLLVGAIALGRWVGWLFLPYLLFWTFCVAAALMSACGVTLYALMPIFPEPHQGKVVYRPLLSSTATTIPSWLPTTMKTRYRTSFLGEQQAIWALSCEVWETVCLRKGAFS